MAACSLCFKPEALNKCSGCGVRPYCSALCEAADWPVGGAGQGHERWCTGVPCGEEGVDWEVRAAGAGRGLGVFALRPFAPFQRVMVDRVFSLRECVELTGARGTAFDALMPAGGSKKAKFDLKRVSSGDESGLGLHFSRLNHSCVPNAFHMHERDTRSKVVVVIGEIQAGAEIFIDYGGPLTGECDPVSWVLMSKSWLDSKWGIVCGSDCGCNDAAAVARAATLRELDADIMRLARANRPREALAAVHERIALLEARDGSRISATRTLYDGYQVEFMTFQGMIARGRLGSADIVAQARVAHELAAELAVTRERLLGPHAFLTLEAQDFRRPFAMFLSMPCTPCSSSTPTKRCGRCKAAHYCSSSCQRADWPRHRAECTKK